MNNNTKPKNIKSLIDVAMNRRKADLVIKNVSIIDVFNSKIIEGDIGIVDGYIAGIGSYEGLKTIDGKGMFASPGFVDSHVHIESSMSTPSKFAESIVPRGTTTIIADPHEIANVQGLEGIEYILKESRKIGYLDIYVMLPSCVPATPFEDSGAILNASDLKKLKDDDRVLGLGEMMNYPGTIDAYDDVLKKLELFLNENIDGHAPLLKGSQLNAYVAAGIKTDHECTNVGEMHEKISLGMYVLIREGSAARDCAILTKGINSSNSRRVLFCTDDRHPEDILKDGHIDNNVNIAIREGLDPIEAIKIAAFNPCECYGIKNKGAIAPGYIADILLFDNLNNIKVKTVIKNGNLVAGNGEMTIHSSELINQDPETTQVNTINYKDFNTDRLKVSIKSGMARVIKLLDNTLLTTLEELNVSTDKDGNFLPGNDLLKVAVVERHNALDTIGIGIIKGYGLKNGAIATSVSHDSHNVIVIGDNDKEMHLAVKRIKEINGGIVLIKNNAVIGEFSLPIGGLMSNEPLKDINTKLNDLKNLAYQELEVEKSLDPFISLSFLALPVIPDIKITNRGLFHVSENSFVDLEIK